MSSPRDEVCEAFCMVPGQERQAVVTGLQDLGQSPRREQVSCVPDGRYETTQTFSAGIHKPLC